MEDCLTENDGVPWIVLSAGEDQAKEFLQRCKTSLNIIKPCYEYHLEDNLPEPEITVSKITFANGKRIIALPANPATARSYSGHVVLDEFAHHEQPEEIWAAVYPIITSPFKGNLKMRVISTPNGRNNLFSQIWHGDNEFSKHRCSIHEAVKQGFKVDVPALKKNMLTEAIWQQEYECAFLDETNQELIIPRSMIDFCVANPPLQTIGYKCAFIDFGGGVAETVVAIMFGNKIEKIVPFISDDMMFTSARCVTVCRENGVEATRTYVDATNGTLGHALADRMQEQGFFVNRVDNGGSAYNPERFSNRGAEIWWEARDAIEKCQVILLKDEDTFSQMSNRGIVYKAKGKVALEDKAKMRGRGIKSPDRADAVCGVISCSKYMTPQKTKFDIMWDNAERNEKKVDLNRLRGMYAG